jgi:hypothetical protein
MGHLHLVKYFIGTVKVDVAKCMVLPMVAEEGSASDSGQDESDIARLISLIICLSK